MRGREGSNPGPRLWYQVRAPHLANPTKKPRCYSGRGGGLYPWSNNNKPFFDGIIIYFWWNIWKERNRRTFNQVSKSEEEVAFLAKEDFQQFSLAFSFPTTLISWSVCLVVSPHVFYSFLWCSKLLDGAPPSLLFLCFPGGCCFCLRELFALSFFATLLIKIRQISCGPLKKNYSNSN